jgi:hypothetical protein
MLIVAAGTTAMHGLMSRLIVIQARAADEVNTIRRIADESSVSSLFD